MVKRVLSAADIERIAIREEGLAAELLDQIDHGAGVVRAQICQIARLTEVQLNRDILILQRELVHSRCQKQAGEFLL